MQKGRGGMGSHKHGVSGNVGKRASQKAAQSRQANEEIERAAALRGKREKAEPKFDTPSDLFKSRRNI